VKKKFRLGQADMKRTTRIRIHYKRIDFPSLKRRHKYELNLTSIQNAGRHLQMTGLT
jgi:hypothetical protein